ncbi:MAG TPA: hypothetical protein VF770_05440, partial [Solirubrobacterales bacterium]
MTGTTVWHGYQATWEMARGYPGAFGHSLNLPYVFLPICALFLVGLLDWRRPWRVASLDLLVLLGFGVSNFFFNRAEIGASVPLQYPVLVYLLARALWIGLRGRGEGIRPVWPASWLLIAALFLIGFRAGLDVADSGVIDVGYAGVVGADRISHGEPLYGNFPKDVSQGDTYGPVSYLAYVPFEAVWPWHGRWDDLPAAHAAALFFDLATFGLLILLGLRIRPGPPGRKLAATLAFGWAAYPYTAYALESNSNDTLVAALLVATLLVLARPAARGATLALATFTKFAPLALAPMLVTYKRGWPAGPVAGVGCPPGAAICSGQRDGVGIRDEALPSADSAQAEDTPPRHHPRERRRGWTSIGPSAGAIAVFTLAFLGVSALVMLWPAIDPGLGTFWQRTIVYQANRESPFSIWGQVPSLEPLRIAILAGTGLSAIAFAFFPRRKNLVQVAALSATLLIGL